MIRKSRVGPLPLLALLSGWELNHCHRSADTTGPKEQGKNFQVGLTKGRTMMKRLVQALACICAFGITLAVKVQAETGTLPHYPKADDQYKSSLSAEEVAQELSLNAAPDAELLTGKGAKKGDGSKSIVNIFGAVRNNRGESVCGLVLANGQFMFSCSPVGTYSLDVPQDGSGQVTLFGFADGHFPFKSVFGGFGGRNDMTLNVATSVIVPPPPPPPTTTFTITFNLTDGCNNGIPIDYKFYDVTNHLVWPSSSTHYSTQAYNATYTHNLTCNSGANVCYGARSASLYWGIDLDGTKSCPDCCISCQSGNSLSRRLSC